MNITTAVLITIGNEILSGKTIDSNSAYISHLLANLGIKVIRILTVSDNDKEIKWAVKTARKAAPLLISTGGLGPTRDDITKHAVAEAYGIKIAVDPEQLRIVEKKFRNAGYRKMPETNISQAEIPEGAVVFPNPRGTAPGLLVSDDETCFLMLPGVPEEMKGIMTDHMIPYLRERMPDSVTIINRTIRTTGMGESAIAEILDQALNSETEIAFLPDILGVDIRLTVRGKDEKILREKIRKSETLIVEKIPEILYGFDEDTLESVVGEMLTSRNLTLAVAESCTGGLVGDRITSVSGSSKYFDNGLITYSNKSKVELLGVRQKTLDACGAVSEEVAAEMAEGIRARSGCDIGVSTTGIAGPTGGTGKKPVGLVYISLSDRFGTLVKKLNLWGDRTKIKQRSARAAINLIRLRLNDKNLYRD